VLAAPDTLDPDDGHQPGHLVAADVVAGLAHGGRQLVGPIQAPVRPPEVHGGVGHVGVVPIGLADRGELVGVVGARGDRHVVLGEHPADRLDTPNRSR
jgi:hypothetical protein